jgi:cystine transport system substrate-binding protein
MDDERIERALRLGPVDEPAYRAQGSWHATGEADVPAGSPGPAPVTAVGGGTPQRVERLGPTGVRLRRAGLASPRRWPMTVAASVTVLIGLLLAMEFAPVGPAATPEPTPDLLARVMAAGSVEIAVRSTAPQTVSQGGAYIGFDIDVAKAVAQQLGLRADVTAVDPGAFSSSTWQVALPGHDASGLGGAVSQPYAYWPVWLAAGEGSAVTDLASLSGARVCVIHDSAGADWLAGKASGATTAAPTGATALVLSSDDACVAAVSDGRADALVTSSLFSDELAARGLHLVVPTPVVSDPWAMVVHGPATDSASLLAAVDDALAALQTSGRLAELSRSSFGGSDVTVASP